MNADQFLLWRLRQAAITTSVHADAIQSSVADIQAALQHLDSDAKMVESFAEQVRSRKAELEKVLEVDAKRKRYFGTNNNTNQTDDADVMQTQQQPKSGRLRTDALSFALSAVEEGELPSRGAVRSGGVEKDHDDNMLLLVGSGDQQEESPEAHRLRTEIELLRARLMQAEAASTGNKIHELQRAKSKAAATIKNELPKVHGAIDNFDFPPEMQQLFVTGVVLDSEEVGSIVDGAVQRLSTRVVDALKLISNIANSSDDPMQIHAASCYRTLAKDPDTMFALEVSELDPDALADHFATIEQHNASKDLSDEASERAEKKRKQKKHTFRCPLSPWHFDFCPPEATNAVMGDITDRTQLLAPAKHLVTPRYSYESRAELRRVEKLRWELQKELLEVYLQSPSLTTAAGGRPHPPRMTVGEARKEALLLNGGRSWPVVAVQSAKEDGDVHETK